MLHPGSRRRLPTHNISFISRRVPPPLPQHPQSPVLCTPYLPCCSRWWVLQLQLVSDRVPFLLLRPSMSLAGLSCAFTLVIGFVARRGDGSDPERNTRLMGERPLHHLQAGDWGGAASSVGSEGSAESGLSRFSAASPWASHPMCQGTISFQPEPWPWHSRHSL